ncbi:MAG: tRNA (N6-threonylcarbamoyladenosine(37)-N6)-methyltransferase TrmO [Thermoplasmatota archaeon]
MTSADAEVPRKTAGQEIRIQPIGWVESAYKTPLDAPRQGEFARSDARLHVLAAYERGLEGIGPGDRLILLWWAHQADRTMLGRPGTDGVFRMRTPHRPNPVCITEVEVLDRDGATLQVRGLDAVDGSPILDMKSARAEYDGWTELPRVSDL